MSKSKKVFLYGELQANVPNFTPEIWEPVNERLKTVPGLIRKTWLVGMNTNTLGGLYEFESEEAAWDFATGPYVEEGRAINASVTVKLFDVDRGEAPSRDMKSPHYN
jgi:hypothetical protein